MIALICGRKKATKKLGGNSIFLKKGKGYSDNNDKSYLWKGRKAKTKIGDNSVFSNRGGIHKK